MPSLELHPTIGAMRYTLRGLYRDLDTQAKKAVQLRREGFQVATFDLTSPAGHPLFAVAARHDVAPIPRAGIPQVHTADWEATRMAIQVFRSVARATGGGLRWYKVLDVQGLRRCVLQYGWTGTVLDVGAGIISTTIVAHPFPNANHRTSLALGRLFLASRGNVWPRYDLRGRGVARFIRDGEPYFRRSKYLLQLLRHRLLLRVALEEGYDRVTLGASSEAPLVEADLAADREELRVRHRRLTQALLVDLAEESALFALRRPNDQGLGDWVRWYWRRSSPGAAPRPPRSRGGTPGSPPAS